MKLAEVSIKRPVFTTMIISAIVVVGLFLFMRLPVDMFPDVDIPIVTVRTIYPGASPETMESQVAEPIEEALGTLGGVDAMQSICLESVSQTVIEFDLEVDLDIAVQDVRDRLSAIQQELPDDAEAPIVEKLDLGSAPILQLAVTGDADPAVLAQYAEDVVQPRIQQINGVGQVELVGNREREVHVYLDPDALRSRGLTALEVAQALGAQNIEIPGGRVDRGEEELILRTDNRAQNAEELGRLAIATIPGGGVIRLEDVARVVDGLEERRSIAELNGQPAIALIVRKQSGQNTVAVAEAVTAVLASIQALAPPGAQLQLVHDNSTSIKASVEAVQFDLVLGAFLAVVIIFVFLRDPRATFISALALPTSVIGTFAFIQAMGFTINMMTTLALSLSIGILIDDAIVVIENIVRRRTALGEGPRDAAYRGTAEIGLAVLATTLSIVAVFVPVAFTPGMIGRFFLQFGLTVAFAVLLSLFVSFTLTPMLSARLLKEHSGEKGLAALVGKLLDGLDILYRGMITWVLRHRIVTSVMALAALGSMVFVAPQLSFTMMPPEDKGYFNVKFEMPPGRSLEETATEARIISEQLREIPGVEDTFARVGGGMLGQVNTAEILVRLTHKSERQYTQQAAQAYARQILGGRSDRILNVEEVSDFGSTGGRFSPVMVILMGNDLDELSETGQNLANRLREHGGYTDVDTTVRPGLPQLEVELDRDLAADLGIMGAPAAMTVRTLMAGTVATRLDDAGERYDVRVQLPPELRSSVETLERAQIRTPANQLVDLGAIARIEESTGANQINRYDRQRQVTVYANLAEGMALGDALNFAEEELRTIAPAGVTYTFSGEGEMLGESITNLGIALLLAIIFIYMVLASQFESFIHPFTIMISLPFSAIGALLGLLITGEAMSIFAMIGFIMLMGLVTKNAILLVDFANQLREQGHEMKESLIEAGAIRLRPILMTTAAMIFGMLPVAIGHGDGGELRMGMGIAVIGGLITSTLLTLLVVPVFYTYMEGVANVGRRIAGVFRKKKPAEHTEVAEEAAS